MMAGQYFRAPLSTGICVPDNVPEPSPASHATTSATSSAVMKPLYCNGIGGKLCTKRGWSANIRIIASGSIIGVSTEYGWIELTLMLYSPSSMASVLVSAVRPCLLAA